MDVQSPPPPPQSPVQDPAQGTAQGDDVQELAQTAVVTAAATAAATAADPTSTTPEFEMVTNDGSDEAGTKLMALKNIFARQLPKMPKDYIVRLVFDERHKSLAIKRHGRIIGGICYRPYREQRFGEIAFCAVNSNEQVKGFGTVLMSQLKAVVQAEGLEYFLTYADNFAIGYFQKQGFSKSITMPKDRWVGYIKDYDGGTLMECYIHPAVPYGFDMRSVVHKQRTFILQRLAAAAAASGSSRVFQLQTELGKRGLSALEWPGVKESGWQSFQVYKNANERDRSATQAKLTATLRNLFDKLRVHQCAAVLWRLRADLNQTRPAAAVAYDDIVAQLATGEYYRSKEALGADVLRLIADIKSRLPADDTQKDHCVHLATFTQTLFMQQEAADQ